MSWSFSQEQVAEFWAECFAGTVPFALLSSTPMPDQFYWPDKPTEHSRISRFGMTCGPLTAIDGEALLTWFLAASRAKTSALPAEVPDWTASGRGYGEKWRGLLGKYDAVSCSLKTAQCSLFADLIESSPTLPRWGLMLVGELYPQPIPALITSEKGSGYWPTPMASSGNGAGHSQKKTGGVNLQTAVKMWPTPCASTSKGSSENALTRQDGKDRSKDRLDHAVMSLDGGQLNPAWVEWLMGWPSGHSELKPLGMGKFQEFMQQHSNCCLEVRDA